MTAGFVVMDTACHVWVGALQSSGYGSLTNGQGGTMLAHRKAWETSNGPIPAGLTIDHLCRNPRCVNVEHMELVTNGENVRRATQGVIRCIRGHEYTPENTARNGQGNRYCKRCAADAQRARRALAAVPS